MTDIKFNKWEMAVNKLVKLTQDHQLEWKSVDPLRFLKNTKSVNAVFVSKYEEKNLILYQIPYQPDPFTTATISGSASLWNPKIPEKDYRSMLSVYDSHNLISFTFPYSQFIEDLYNSAAYNASKVEDLINSLLEKKP